MDAVDGVDVATVLPRGRFRRVSTEAGANIGGVPTISRFYGLVITMYFDDHKHPHFHVRHAEGAAKVRIDVIEVLDSRLATQHLRLALVWAELHQD